MLLGVETEGIVCAGGKDAGFDVDPVDLKHLRRYTLGDESLEKEVLELFLAQLPQTITALSTAASDREWKIAAHTLKGSGRAVGAWRIARLAEHAERIVADRSRRACSDAVTRIEEAAREAHEFIFALYGSQRQSSGA